MTAPHRVTVNGTTAYIPSDIQPLLKHRNTMPYTTDAEREFADDVVNVLRKEHRNTVWFCSFESAPSVWVLIVYRSGYRCDMPLSKKYVRRVFGGL